MYQCVFVNLSSFAFWWATKFRTKPLNGNEECCKISCWPVLWPHSVQSNCFVAINRVCHVKWYCEGCSIYYQISKYLKTLTTTLRLLLEKLSQVNLRRSKKKTLYQPNCGFILVCRIFGDTRRFQWSPEKIVLKLIGAIGLSFWRFA